ncbi:hypothetical protein CEXT_178831 [Caerostris extrusa]|uniref:Uncharacterized protein n=1 Tax=Caerostris extrusa TaxID=172846 RepID=A0AAV4Y1G8_CAEEX|nr:hypothetical protein CEXT_178831 [Caerostris extrusa]
MILKHSYGEEKKVTPGVNEMSLSFKSYYSSVGGGEGNPNHLRTSSQRAETTPRMLKKNFGKKNGKVGKTKFYLIDAPINVGEGYIGFFKKVPQMRKCFNALPSSSWKRIVMMMCFLMI